MASRGRKKGKKLTVGQAAKHLDNLAEIWPDDLQLFSWSGTLVLVKPSTGEIVHYVVDGIRNDGGDPQYYEENGREYMEL